MALIQKIREKSGLVMFTMALAIVSFIAMLMTQDSNRTWGSYSNTSTVASVAGKELDIRQMEKTAELMYGQKGSDLNIRNSFFNSFVESALVGKEAEKIGLGVGKDELLDLEFGPAPSSVITNNQALMQDPKQLGEIQKAIASNTLPAQGKEYWSEIENQVIKDRLQTKLNTLVAKGIYSPSWLVDEGYKELTQPIDFEYVKVPFDRIDDKDAPITDADYAAYLAENKARFTADEELRSMEYVTFDVIPTLADSMKLFTTINDLKNGLRTAVNDSSYATSHNGGVTPQYSDKNAQGLSQAIKDSLFNAPVGTVIGPYVDAKAYWLAKLVDRKNAPDSVKSRHILIQGQGGAKIADSLKAILVANPAMWDSLNAKFSGDPGAKSKGGDLGYQAQGMFVPEFNDMIFYKAKQGDFNTVNTQFGTHIIQVTGVKAGKSEPRIKLALIREAILPSAATDKAASAAADDLLINSKNIEELRKNAQAKGLTVQPSQNFRANDMQLGAFGAAEGVRQIMRWAFEAKAGERCKNTFSLREAGDAYNSRYVVGALKNIVPKGLPTVATLKEQLTPYVKNRKKGEVLKAKINATDLPSLAAQFNAKVDTAKGVTFNATMVPNLGSESKLIGAAFTTEVNQLTKAVIGESGVLVAKVTDKRTITDSPVDKNVLRQQMVGQMKGQVRGFLLRSLKKNATITDNRSKFF